VLKECAKSGFRSRLLRWRQPNLVRLSSPDCVIALRQLTTALEVTQECIDQWLNIEEAASIEPLNVLPTNRKSLAFIQLVFKHKFTPSTINHAIDAVEEFQFEVTKYHDEAESSFQHLWYLYTIQNFCTLRGHDSAESLVSLSSRASVASISGRIAEVSAYYTENGGKPVDESIDPVQWLEEQALQADLHPPPANARVLLRQGEGNSTREGEVAASNGDSSVSIESS